MTFPVASSFHLFQSYRNSIHLLANLFTLALPGSCPPSPSSNQSTSSNQGVPTSSSNPLQQQQQQNQQSQQQHQQKNWHNNNAASGNLKQQHQRGGSSSSSKGGASKSGSGPSSRHGSPFNGSEAEMNEANNAMNGSGAHPSAAAAGDGNNTIHIIQDIGKSAATTQSSLQFCVHDII